MNFMKIKLQRKDKAIHKAFNLPGDKSIAHRSLIIGALGKGSYNIKNFPDSLDCLTTLNCMKQLGVEIEINENNIYVNSPGYLNFNKGPGILNANNSGTTARLLSGLVSGCGIECTLDGDNSLRKRPMDRVINPLLEMGAVIEAEDNLLPVHFKKNNMLNGIEYIMPVSSAQVKSSILIAGFLSKGETLVKEKESTRDHTERMFGALGVDIKVDDKVIAIKNSYIQVKDIVIPGDISSAAFLIACTILSEDSEIKFMDVLLNERRRKYLDILIKMGANLEYEVINNINGEDIGYIFVKSSKLKGINILNEEIPNIIDEIPMLAVLAVFSSGKTIINGIKELKYKESNRIKSIVENLVSIGFNVAYSEDHIEIEGQDALLHKDICINPYNDHRIALAFTAIALKNLGDTFIDNWECTNISFPNSINYFKEFLNIHTQQ
jgi:3-phosphoshikimate 1-carboxyvinyltransferase